MKVMAINGSPRRNGNTAALLQHAINGACCKDAEVTQVNLYELSFRGCMSCFSCKRKDIPHGNCALRDDLTPILAQLKEADVLLLGSPIYYDNITSGMAAFFGTVPILQLYIQR